MLCVCFFFFLRHSLTCPWVIFRGLTCLSSVAVFSRSSPTELRLPNMEMTVQECVDALIRTLETGGILTGGPTDPSGLPMPDGDEIVDLHVDPR